MEKTVLHKEMNFKKHNLNEKGLTSKQAEINIKNLVLTKQKS